MVDFVEAVSYSNFLFSDPILLNLFIIGAFKLQGRHSCLQGSHSSLEFIVSLEIVLNLKIQLFSLEKVWNFLEISIDSLEF